VFNDKSKKIFFDSRNNYETRSLYTEKEIFMKQLRGCIQKFPDWVDNEINNNNNNNNNKHSLRSNTKGYGGKTHYTDSQNSDKTASSSRELYHLQFLLQAASSETFGYTFVYRK
jgi:hypothetical protein